MDALASRLELVSARLRQQGCRLTPQRLAIVASVLTSQRHPTAQAVYESLRAQYPTMSLTTVYKTLHLLASVGEVAQVAADDGTAHYDADVTPHVHLICERCGLIADSTSGTGIDPLASVEALGWALGGWRLEVYGLCPVCSGTTAP